MFSHDVNPSIPSILILTPLLLRSFSPIFQQSRSQAQTHPEEEDRAEAEGLKEEEIEEVGTVVKEGEVAIEREEAEFGDYNMLSFVTGTVELMGKKTGNDVSEYFLWRRWSFGV